MNPIPERNQCPCGCNSPLPVIQGKRRIVCVKFFDALPAHIREDIRSKASDAPTRRRAIRQALDLAKAHAAKRADEQQLRLL